MNSNTFMRNSFIASKNGSIVPVANAMGDRSPRKEQSPEKLNTEERSPRKNDSFNKKLDDNQKPYDRAVTNSPYKEKLRKTVNPNNSPQK